MTEPSIAAATPAASTEAPLDAHVEETRRALVRNVGFDLFARAGYLISRVCIPPFVLARVGLSAYSLWNAVFLIVSYVGVGSMGFTAAYIKLVAEYVARNETRKANSVLSSGLIFSGLAYGIFFVALATVMPELLHWFAVPPALRADARYVILMVIGVHSLGLVLSVFGAALAGCQRVLEVQVIWVCNYLLEAALIFGLLATGHGVRGLADAYAISTIASIALAATVAHRRTKWLRISPRLLTRPACRALFRFGGVLQLSALLAQLMEAGERLVAAPLIGLDAIGLLDLGAKLPRTVATIPSALVNAIFPASSYLHAGLTGAAERQEILRQLYLRGSRYTMLVSAAALGFAATAASPVLHVWLGREYPGVTILMMIFAVQQHFDCMTGTGTTMVRGIGKPWQEYGYSIPNILLAATLMPLSYVVLGRWSTLGLGGAMAAAQIAAALMFVGRANRIFEVSWRAYLGEVFAPTLLPYAVGVMVAIPLTRVVAAVDRWRGVVAVGGGGLLYLLLLVWLIDRFVLTLEERSWFRKVVAQYFSSTAGFLKLSRRPD